jgi:methylenetetrahydrofolate reductase (NADPH)
MNTPAQRPSISFEFFPPKNENTAKVLWEAVPALAALGPHYMTVTYGAGGSTRDGTRDTLRRMQNDFKIPVASHLTFINTRTKDLLALTDELWAQGVRHIVALRGDMPKDLAWPLDNDGDYYQYTSDFVEGLLAQHPFEISVSAYPEKHPDAPDLAADIVALKKKCDAGATRAITQFFFDNDVYFEFVEQVRKAGITTPICPGVLPVHDFKGMLRFAERCRASVPAWMHKKFEGLENAPEDARKVAEELLISQVLDLRARGVEHIHFYTLNKSSITQAACKALGY